MASQSVGESAVAAGPSLTLKPSLTIERRINAPPEKIYAAWTEPKNLIRWFGPAMVKQETVRANIDARIGGRYRISFDDEHGKHHEVGGTYRELVPYSRVVFSWAWHSTPERESQVTVLLRPDGAGTLLTLHHEQFFDAAARDAHEQGWTGTLDKLQRILA
jgi:uncharacterized protein YndB with AHSA1/START domain